RSANARHSSIPENSQGMRNLPGSPSFLGMVGPLYATPLRVVIPFRSSLGLVTVLLGSVPDPEDEAMLELMNLDIISVRLANWRETGSSDLVRNHLRMKTDDSFGTNEYHRSDALTMSLSLATSDEMAGVEEFEFT
nr:hypothetical protein [Tanacetum cinerariifolium]